MASGDLVVFYRTKIGGAAHHTSVVTTIGIIESVMTPVPSLNDFIRLCRKRSVFTEEELKKHWNYFRNLKPFVVNFLYVHSLPKRLNLARLKEENIIAEAPRGFEEISDAAFSKLIEISNANTRFIVD
jgi:hypothetical protein